MKTDSRFSTAKGREIYTGNELLVKGALETEGGVHLMTGYPGSPIAGFFDTLESIAPLLNEHGVVASIANNEALSVAMVNGAQMVGCRAMTAFKSVGLHVASDALALGVLGGTRHGGGGLIICGDDPWNDSTQVPADSRFLAEHVRMPVVEPTSPQELKDWVNLSFQLGAAAGIYIGYIVTVALADGGGSVEVYPNKWPALNENQKKSLSYVRDIEPNLEDTVLLPPRTSRRELALDECFAKVKVAARELGINKILHPPQKGERAPLGFIASGNGYAYLAHALTEMGLAGRLPILKLGMSYPVDEHLVIEFAKRCEQIVVVEERRSFVERQVLAALNPLMQKGVITTRIYGKKFPDGPEGTEGFPHTRGLNPSIVMEKIIPLIKDHPTLPIELTNGRLTEMLARLRTTAEVKVDIPTRTPAYCPGCPHRDSSSALLELRRDLLDPQYMLTHHKRKPVDLVAHGDTGCYTMMMFEPNKPLMHNYSGMGLGGGTGAGADPFIDNKQLVFLGDGTFFHSGQSAISNSIYSGQDITYIILDNKTTAMTGHQHNAGDNVDLRGRPTFAQDIERTVKGMIPKKLSKDVRIVRIDPADRQRYRKLLEQTILADGVKIVIADKECGITFHRRARAAESKEEGDLGFIPRKTYMNVASETCEFCLECTQQTGCPALTFTDTDYGRKVQTHFSTCVNDGACQRINACPAFEEVTVIRKQRPRKSDEYVDLSEIPDPPRPIHANQETWRCYLSGVGGMGIGTATSIVVMAGHEMGYDVQFLDKKGLAIRNGGVYSQVVYSRKDEDKAGHDPAIRNGHSRTTTPLITYGQADLLIGVDLLEASRALDPSLPQRVVSSKTSAIVNTTKTPTILTLMGQDDFEPDDLEALIRDHTNAENYFGFNVSDLCERMLDSNLYANIMMLGIAYQRGYLPLKLEAIEKAIRTVIRREVDRNMRAFNIGRMIVVKPELFVVELRHQYETSRQALRRKLNTIHALHRGRRGRILAKKFRVLMKQTFRAMRGRKVDDPLIRDVVIRAYDCLIWGGMDYAKRYCQRLVAVFRMDDPKKDFRLTRAVVWNLAKTMLIKDEPYVAAMLTSPEKYKRDRRRFSVNPANGDRVVYRHHNIPEIEIFGHTFRSPYPIKARDWQLRLVAKMRWLRKVIFPHKSEVAFRDWYEALVDRIGFDGDRDYQRWVAIMETPATVTGYREVRYPKQDAARRRAEELLAMAPEEFDAKPGVDDLVNRIQIRLPVLSSTQAGV